MEKEAKKKRTFTLQNKKSVKIKYCLQTFEQRLKGDVGYRENHLDIQRRTIQTEEAEV